MPFLFAITLFVSAMLLFLVEPMVAKMVLPLLGGTPAVWNTCMVFFQAALLAGYAYAHATTQWLGTRRQVLLHLVLLALPLLLLPVSISNWQPPSDSNPIPSLLLMLVLSVGLPFFVLSSSAPLLQKWFAATDHPSARDPYFLYAASNVGSMLALFAYPALVEPNLHLKANQWFSFDTQSGLWSMGYGLMVVLMLACAWAAWHSPKKETVDAKKKFAHASEDEDETLSSSPPSILTQLRWLALAFVPSSLMLGVTTFITLDIAAIPLLWVIPLGLYLLSFIIVFARWPAVMHRMVVLGAPLAILLLVFVRLADPKGVVLKISIHLLALFAVAMLCHGELARTRPATKYLTGFYLLMSVGGVLGGLFNALVAPLVFNDLYEYSIALVLACMLVPTLATGGTTLTAWILKSLAMVGSHSAFGTLSKGMLWLLDYSKRGWLGRFTGLVLDLGFAVLLGYLAFGFITFFKVSDEDASWLKRLPSGIGSLHEWVANRLANVNETRQAQLRSILEYGIPILVCYALVARPIRFGLGVAALFIAASYATSPGLDDFKVIHQERSFFGVLKVEHKEKENSYLLMHGTTTHGMQIRTPEHEFEPLTYYHETGPIGHVFSALQERLQNKDIGLIGLGSGTLACYGKSGQRFRFYDIDPSVERIAKNPAYFTYYQNCKADKKVILGDARLRMADAEPGQYQLIIVDAFSSDAIPIHLITREAIELYFRKMKPDGVLAVHISNRYLNLEPVLANIAAKLGYVAVREKDNDDSEVGKYSSDWVILARKSQDFGALGQDERWKPAKVDKDVGVWTDDFSNLLSVFER
ncbi:MAG TPA: fused MFS/spermidine synthase [Gemmataceae bacterium]|nr:fused MFS/spermidine synthase [Gemmataceae bacterium]